MNKIRKLTALLLACTMIIALAACGQNSSSNNNQSESTTSGSNSNNSAGNSSTNDGSATKKDTLSIAISVDRGTLDPRNTQAADIDGGLRMIYQNLWDWDENSERIWVLATGVEEVEPTRWIVNIREGVTFSNGNPLTASDVVFSLNLWNNRPGETPLIRLFDYENSRVIDDYTCELAFSEYNAVYQNTLTNCYIFDQESFDPDTSAQVAIGTGPYVVSEYVVNSHLFLTARDDYWGETPAIKNLEFRVLAEATQRVNALQIGTVDISSITPQDVEFVKSFPEYDTSSRTSSSISCIFFNVVEGTLFHKNTDARYAVAHAIDVDAIIRIAYNGLATRARMPGSMANTDIEDRMLDLGIYDGNSYNPELAREYAEKAGLVGKEIRLITDPNPQRVMIAELLQQNLREIGVELSIRQIDQAAWVSSFFDPYTADWDIGIDFMGTPNLLLARAYEDTLMRWLGGAYEIEEWPGRDRAKELYMGIMAIPNPADRSERLYELNQILVDALIWYSYCDTQTFLTYNKGLKDFAQARNRNGVVNYALLDW